MVHTAVDPEAAIAALTDAIENDPLVGELTDPDDVLVAFDRVQRVRTRALLLLNNAIAGGQESRIEVLESTGAYSLGETPNEFSGDTLAVAETALDDYTDDAANAVWLAGYDADGRQYVVLEYD